MRPGRALSVAASLLVLTTVSEVRADARCEADHLHAQQDRDGGALLRAREELLRCSAAACPSLVQADCEAWLEAVTKDLPTIVPSARAADGAELSDVRVLLDDAPWLDALDGKAIAVDPGPHVLRFSSKKLGEVEVSIVAKTGAKNEIVSATFAPAPPPTGPRPRTIATLTLLGAGGAALVTFAGLSIAGEVRYHHLKTSCAPACPHDDVGRVRSEFIAADVSLALGSALVGAGAIVYLTTPAPRATEPPKAAFALRPEPLGASAEAVFTW